MADSDTIAPAPTPIELSPDERARLARLYGALTVNANTLGNLEFDYAVKKTQLLEKMSRNREAIAKQLEEICKTYALPQGAWNYDGPSGTVYQAK
jgi:hypothetical protein